VQLLTEHAAVLAPALAPLLEQSTPAVRRTLLRILGAAGTGYEAFVGAYVSDAEEATAREALRALARLGTATAAGLVVAEIEKQRGPLSVAAEETLWHFPLREAQRHTRELLAKRDFTMSHPQATERLLDRAARAGAADLEPVLLGLAPMRFRVWNPALARLARKANAMLKAPAKTVSCSK
jgi:HEAT repeat protein